MKNKKEIEKDIYKRISDKMMDELLINGNTTIPREGIAEFIGIDQGKIGLDTSSTYCGQIESFDSEKLHEVLLRLEPIKKRVILVNELYFEEFVNKINGKVVARPVGLNTLHGIDLITTDNEYRTARDFLEKGYDEVYIITRQNMIMLDQKFLDFITLPIYPGKKLK